MLVFPSDPTLRHTLGRRGETLWKWPLSLQEYDLTWIHLGHRWIPLSSLWPCWPPWTDSWDTGEARGRPLGAGADWQRRGLRRKGWVHQVQSPAPIHSFQCHPFCLLLLPLPAFSCWPVSLTGLREVACWVIGMGRERAVYSRWARRK